MAADGEDAEEAGLMAYRPGGGCRAMQLPVEVERASGVPFADKQTEGESGEERMGSARDERRGNPSVLTEQEDRRGGRRVRE